MDRLTGETCGGCHHCGDNSVGPVIAKAEDTGLPWVKVCRITAAGKLNEPSARANAMRNRVRSVNAMYSTLPVKMT